MKRTVRYSNMVRFTHPTKPVTVCCQSFPFFLLTLKFLASNDISCDI